MEPNYLKVDTLFLRMYITNHCHTQVYGNHPAQPESPTAHLKLKLCQT